MGLEEVVRDSRNQGCFLEDLQYFKDHGIEGSYRPWTPNTER